MASPRTNQRKSKKNEVAPEQVLVEGFFRVLGQIAAAVFKALRPSGSGKNLSSDRKQQLAALQEHWETVEMHLLQEQGHALAVSEADKILDSAFKILGMSGETMADRLRAAEARLGSDLYQRIWNAHKLRNALAHELGASVSAEQANQAVGDFRQALYTLGVLS